MISRWLCLISSIRRKYTTPNSLFKQEKLKNAWNWMRSSIVEYFFIQSFGIWTLICPEHGPIVRTSSFLHSGCELNPAGGNYLMMSLDILTRIYVYALGPICISGKRAYPWAAPPIEISLGFSIGPGYTQVKKKKFEL